MIKCRFIKNSEDIGQIWERRLYFRLEQFLLFDLIKIFNYLFPQSKIKSRKNHYKHFIQHFGQIAIKDIQSTELNFWFQKIKYEFNLTDRTLAQVKSQINSFFKWLVFEEILTSNPLQKIKILRKPLSSIKRTVFNEQEISNIVDRAKEFDPILLYPFLYTIIHTGARRSEVMKLKWQDIDLESKVLIFRDTKNGDSRTIKISENLLDTLRTLNQNGLYVFSDSKGNNLNRAKVQRLMNKFKNRHPLERDWNYHDLRHSFAYNFLRKGGEMYQNGGQMYELMAVLGHKSISLTIDLYGKLRSEDIEDPSPYNFE